MDKEFWNRLQRATDVSKAAKARSRRGEYVPPAPGLAHARFVGYFELGKHEEIFRGNPVLFDKVDLLFELSGPNHPPRELDDGLAIPHRIMVRETLIFDYRMRFPGLFATMNRAHGNFATHIAQLLCRPFRVEVFHRLSADGAKVYAGLLGPLGYNIGGIPDAVEVAPAMTDARYFLWDAADKEMWDSIHIPGFYEERKDEKTGEVTSPKRSKNVIQERIMAAKNWPELASRLAAFETPPETGSLGTNTHEELDIKEPRELKAFQEENWRRLKAITANALGHLPEEQPNTRARSARRRPPKAT